MIKLSESIWSDIQKRSSGEITRKEDDINRLDIDGLYDYFKSKYKQTKKNKHLINKVIINIKISLSFPVLVYIDPNTGMTDTLYISFYENQNIRHKGNYKGEGDIITISPYSLDVIPGLSDFLKGCVNFKKIIKTDTINSRRINRKIIHIYPYDGSPITNKFYADFIEYIIKNWKEQNHTYLLFEEI